MAEGMVIAEGPPQTIVTNDEVIDAYLGTHRAARHRVGDGADLAEADTEHGEP
jgi:hypothetical protein